MRSFIYNNYAIPPIADGMYAICNKCWATNPENVMQLRLNAREEYGHKGPWTLIDEPMWVCVICSCNDDGIHRDSPEWVELVAKLTTISKLL